MFTSTLAFTIEWIGIWTCDKSALLYSKQWNAGEQWTRLVM